MSAATDRPEPDQRPRRTPIRAKAIIRPMVFPSPQWLLELLLEAGVEPVEPVAVVLLVPEVVVADDPVLDVDPVVVVPVAVDPVVVVPVDVVPVVVVPVAVVPVVVVPALWV